MEQITGEEMFLEKFEEIIENGAGSSVNRTAVP